MAQPCRDAYCVRPPVKMAVRVLMYGKVVAAVCCCDEVAMTLCRHGVDDGCGNGPICCNGRRSDSGDDVCRRRSPGKTAAPVADFR